MRRSEADEEFSARRGTVAPADDGLKVELKTRKIVFNGALERKYIAEAQHRVAQFAARSILAEELEHLNHLRHPVLEGR